MRTERDFLGKIEIPENAFYGIHSVRARENFPDTSPFHIEWYRAMGTVKKACYITAKDFLEKGAKNYDIGSMSLKFPSLEKLEILRESAEKCEEGEFFDNFIVPAVSGGAGTSINMNVNEIITNISLKRMGESPGDYRIIDPIEDANIFQSTNDVVPTALKVATMRLLIELEKEINLLRSSTESKEKAYRRVIRTGYTQMQAAVPTTYGNLLSTYSDALSRDWWRVSKCLERIKVVNLGGSAIGTSVSVPNYFMLEAARTLQRITNLPLTRGENLSDATNNLDQLVEVHGILKAHAVNLEKMASDIRLLGSDIYGSGKISIPQKQAGSSIMPSKVNPVIPEFIISACHKVYSNDQLITTLSAQGCLELNAYLPIIGHALIESLKLLTGCNKTFSQNLMAGLKIDQQEEETSLMSNPSTTTLLLPYIGYNRAGELATFMKKHKVGIIEANRKLGSIDEKKLIDLLKPGNIVKGGYRLKDLDNEKE